MIWFSMSAVLERIVAGCNNQGIVRPIRRLRPRCECIYKVATPQSYSGPGLITGGGSEAMCQRIMRNEIINTLSKMSFNVVEVRVKSVP